MPSPEGAPAESAAVAWKSVMSFPMETSWSNVWLERVLRSFSISFFLSGFLILSFLRVASTSSAAPPSTSSGWPPNCCWMMLSRAS
uniref:Uncharacterized protein n=1 Tax=Arundo donax TaxID=35708 RepID=A0A0A9D809_ARUDO